MYLQAGYTAFPAGISRKFSPANIIVYAFGESAIEKKEKRNIKQDLNSGKLSSLSEPENQLQPSHYAKRRNPFLKY